MLLMFRLAVLFLFATVVVLWASFVLAHDSHYAISTEMKTWFDGLRSLNGPCCADADGSVITDADWESRDNHYRVRLDDKWMDVPDNAVVKAPNLYGPTMVWPVRANGYNYGYGVKEGPVVAIRCFMPGSMG